MNTASTISKRRRAADRVARATRLARRRKARAWLDLLTLHMTNPRMTDRMPGEKLLTFFESRVIWNEALARLEKNHPDLFSEVQTLFAESSERTAKMSFEEWRAGAHEEGERLSRLRRKLRRDRVKAGRSPGVY